MGNRYSKEVLTTECLSKLYGTPVDVLRVRGRVLVVNTNEDEHHHIDKPAVETEA